MTSPRALGGNAQGGTLAAPIFKAWAQKAYDGLEKLPFRAPAGIRMVRIDRASGRPVYGGWPSTDDPKAAVIWEAFKPQSEQRRAARHAPANGSRRLTAAPGWRSRPPRVDSDFLQRQGGIY